jgi:hypothetical protein
VPWLLLAEEPRGERAQRKSLGIFALARCIHVRELLEVLDSAECVLEQSANRCQEVVHGAALGEQDLQRRLGLVPLSRARLGKPLDQRIPPGLGD